MQYIIYDAENRLYLQQDRTVYALVTDMDKATKYKELKKAKNVCKNRPKVLRDYNLSVVEVSKDGNGISADESCGSVEEFELDYDILDKTREIADVAKRAERRKTYLTSKLREADLAVVDIEHAAEFYNLNASQGYKLYKMLHDVTMQRRKYKDELQMLGNFLGSSVDSKSMENLEKSIIGLGSRKYTPRVINELFDV